VRRDLIIADRRNQSKTSKAQFINPPHPSFSEGGSKTEKHLFLPRGSWGTLFFLPLGAPMGRLGRGI